MTELDKSIKELEDLASDMCIPTPDHIKAIKYIINLLTRPVKGIIPDLPQTTWGDVADDSGLGDKYSCRSRLIAYRQQVAQNIKLLRLEEIIEQIAVKKEVLGKKGLARSLRSCKTDLAQAIRQALEKEIK